MIATTLEQRVMPTADPVATTTKVVLTVEYNGTRYHGFQLQAGLPTVQGEIEEALRKLTGDEIRVSAASRTDSGVHALGQIVSFRTRSPHSRRTFVNGLNYYLPRDIAVKEAYRVSDRFNVRRQAISREYNYYILNHRVRAPLARHFYYLITSHLDSEAMNEASRALVGEHDFASFVNNKEAAAKVTIRKVHTAGVERDGEFLVFNMIANAFLMHQVRNTVGTLIRVGLGRMSLREFCSIMEAARPGLAWPTAPACGLYLMKVNYEHPFEEEVC